MISTKFQLTKKEIDKGIIIPKTFSPDLAYLSGVLAGDGNISYRKEKNEYVIKCVGNPLDEKEFYYNVLKPKFSSVFSVDIKPNYFDSKTTFGFVLYSKNIVTFLNQVIGLPIEKFEKMPNFSKKNFAYRREANQNLLIF